MFNWHIQLTFFAEKQKSTDLMTLTLLLKVTQVIARDDFAAELALGRLQVLCVFL